MKLVFMALVCATTMSCVNRKDHKIMKHPLDKSQIRKIVLENRLPPKINLDKIIEKSIKTKDKLLSKIND